MIAVHLGALLAPWTFSWAGLGTAVGLVLLTGPLGVGVGYHRLLCHRGFRTTGLLRSAFALLGVLALQCGPLTWCGIHRLHHRHADGALDPQSSRRGSLWAHLLWTVADHLSAPTTRRDILRITRDLQREPVLRWLERFFHAVNVVFFLGLFSLGWASGGVSLAASLFVWGFFVRVVYVWHITFLVNSVGHRWGYRNYPCADNSRNCWWVALLTFGEGWHNNHHHHPRCAAHGHRWFEVDATFQVIRLLEWLGLAHEVIRPLRARFLTQVTRGTMMRPRGSPRGNDSHSESARS
jgi:stearoyl-CoA desaturase (delta-9 desaturase)